MRATASEETAAVAAVARHFSAAWRKGGDPPAAYMTLDGRRLAVAVAALAPGTTAGKPRLRYDRVALRFLRDLRDRLRPSLADGDVAILTIRAPILQAGKTVDALAERFRSQRGGTSKKMAFQARAFGNRISVRLLRNAWRGPEVLGFVHSEGSSPAVIANAVQSLLECLRADAGDAAAKADGGRLLVLLGASRLADTHRDACAQLANPPSFARIVLLDEGGRVETLAG